MITAGGSRVTASGKYRRWGPALAGPPTVCGPVEALRLAAGERARGSVPHEVLDDDRAWIDPQHVECVRLAAHARRRRGSCLDDDCRPAANVVTLRRRPREGDVQMARQEYIDPIAG